MTLSWHKDKPVAVSDKIQIPSYTLTDYKYYSSVDEFTTGMNQRFFFFPQNIVRKCLKPHMARTGVLV